MRPFGFSSPIGRAFLLLLLILRYGYARSPLFNVFGSYFPGWMLCVLAAIVLTVLIHLAVRRAGLNKYVEPAGLTYSALTLFFSFTFWLIAFA
ncbi:MAG TPA: YtcA family lipoprotein [Bryobacteraceae bacterium]|jgi:hypothetical protein|nr:YtcA family lipoprotein [Bryobacteraceae bacterium]